MSNTTDDYEYMFVAGCPKYTAVAFSILATLVSAAFLYGVIWFEQFESDTLKTVQVFIF